MKLLGKILCVCLIIGVLLTLVSFICSYIDVFRSTALDDFLLAYLGLTPPSTIIEEDNIDVFFDGSYTEYNGGEDAAAFFNNYVELDNYKDIAFHYRYSSMVWATNVGVIHDASGFVVDVYYEEKDFLDIVQYLAPYTEAAEKLEHNVLHSGYPFYITTITDDSLNQENVYSVMFDKQHFTIRYLCIVGFYKEGFRKDTEQIDVEFASLKIRPTAELIMQIKWNDAKYENGDEAENVEDWIFDYSDIIDIETSDETSSGASE